jgi:redox-sensitive bicupin YhaK (pirin superfamily)
MEILTYVLEGAIAHKDSMGHEQVLGPNEIQRMSAGTGVMHSEYNASKTEPLHFFQIWIEPATGGTQPSYEQLRFDPAEKQNKLKLLASPERVPGAAQINQDAKVYVADLSKGSSIPYTLEKERAVWVHAVNGEVEVNSVTLKEGDAAAVTGEDFNITATGSGSNEVLLFDVK